MKTTHRFGSVIGVLAVLMLGACQNMGPAPYPANPDVAHSRDARPMYGVVKSIEVVRRDNQGIAGSNIGLGAIAGAVIGGVVGNQIGSGTGNTVATVAGAAGGAEVPAERVFPRDEQGLHPPSFEGGGGRAGDLPGGGAGSDREGLYGDSPTDQYDL